MKTISMQVFYNVLREFCRSCHAFGKCTPKPKLLCRDMWLHIEKALAHLL